MKGELTNTDNHIKMLSKETKECISELFKKIDVIEEKENGEMTIRWNNGGILYLKVKKEKIYK